MRTNAIRAGYVQRRTKTHRALLRLTSTNLGRILLFMPFWLGFAFFELSGTQAATPIGALCVNVAYIPNSAPLQQTFNTLTATVLAWPNTAVQLSAGLFAALIGFQLVWTLIQIALRNEGSLQGAVNGIALEIVQLYIPLMVFTQLPGLLKAYFDGMLRFGPAIAAQTPPAALGNFWGGFQPAYYGQQGACLFQSMVADVGYIFSRNQGSWLNPAPVIEAAIGLIPALFAGAVLLGCFVLVAYAFYFIAIEVYIVAGFFPLAWSLYGLRATQGYPSNALGKLLAEGFAVAGISALAAFGNNLAGQWSIELLKTAQRNDILAFFQVSAEVCVGAITYALLVLFVPFGIKRFYGGDPSALIGGIVLMARSASRTGGGSSSPTGGGGGGKGGGGGGGSPSAPAPPPPPPAPVGGPGGGGPSIINVTPSGGTLTALPPPPPAAPNTVRRGGS